MVYRGGEETVAFFIWNVIRAQAAASARDDDGECAMEISSKSKGNINRRSVVRLISSSFFFFGFSIFFSTFLLHGSLGIQAAARQCDGDKASRRMWLWQRKKHYSSFSDDRGSRLLFSQIHNQQSSVQ